MRPDGGIRRSAGNTDKDAQSPSAPARTKNNSFLISNPSRRWWQARSSQGMLPRAERWSHRFRSFLRRHLSYRPYASVDIYLYV